MFHVAALLFYFLAVGSAVPVINQGSNNKDNDWGSGWGNTNNNGNQNALDASITQFDKFALLKKFLGVGPSDDLTRENAENYMKEWIGKQNPQEREKYTKAWSELETFDRNLLTVLDQGMSSLSAEAKKPIEAIKNFYENDSLTLGQNRAAIRNVLQSMSPSVQNEYLNFIKQVESNYTGQFGVPTIAGRPIFANSNSNNNGNDGWGNNGNAGNSGNSGWGQNNNNNNGWGGNNANNNGNNGWGGNNANNNGNDGWGNSGNSGNSGWGQNTKNNNKNDGWGTVGNGGDQGWNSGNDNNNNGWGQNQGSGGGWGNSNNGGQNRGNDGWGNNNNKGNNNGWGQNPNSGSWGGLAAAPRRIAIGKGVEPVKKA